MQRAIRILAILGTAQLALVAVIWMFDGAQHEVPGGALLSFDPVSIDRIEVASESRRATLVREGDGWTMPEHHNLPVPTARIDSLLSTLHAVEAGWPVATSASAAERFEVAENNFQRHVKLFNGESLQAEFWVGTSPGFRKIHTRRAGDDAVYAVTLALHEMPDDPDSWFEKSLLAIKGDIEAIHTDGFGVERNGDQWEFSPLVAANNADHDAVQTWVDRFASLTVGDALELEPPAEPTREFKIRTANTTEILTLFKDGDDWRISGSLHPGVFELPAWVADPLLAATPESLSANDDAVE